MNEENEDQQKAIPLTGDMLVSVNKADDRVDLEKHISYLPKITIFIIMVNVLVFIWQLLTNALASRESIIAAGALMRERVLVGEYWRLISAVFLHGSFDHLLGNSIILYILGLAFEHAFGSAKTAILYLLSGLTASLLSVTMSPGPSVGASGAIFGLWGALIVFLYKHKDKIIMRNDRIKTVLLIWAGYEILGGFLNPYIDNFAHIGGFLGGMAITLFMAPIILGKTDKGPLPLIR
ncbi:MAG: rhomboid family intramembrane serine protease [bacterium]|nr:rhomboid family intramembrane serine protease [bacterium]